jgi:hypothetical protein
MMLFRNFDRTASYRKRLDETKKSLEDFRNILNNRAILQRNEFIKPIFNGYNVLISIHECVRRGIKPITQSLQMSENFPDCANFIVEAVPKDLENAAHLIATLYYQGCHSNLRPDELAFLHYFHNPSNENGRCFCGKCCLYEDSFISTTANVTSSFNPRSISSFSIPRSESRRLRSDSYDSTEELLDEMENQPDVPDNPTPVQSENVFYQRDHRSFIVRLPARSYEEAHNSYPEGFIDIQISDSLLEDLDLYLADQLDESFLEPVPVLMTNACYNNSVKIAVEESVDKENECPICLQKMSKHSNCLDELCVTTKCCGKTFHDKCLRHQLINVGPPKCPMCRTDLRFLGGVATDDESVSAEIGEIFQQ